MEYYYKMQLEVVKKTGQIPNDIAASAQQLMAQMAQAEQAEQEAAMQEQMMQEQMMQQQGGMEQPTAPV
jgi:hypothetical protein